MNSTFCMTNVHLDAPKLHWVCNTKCRKSQVSQNLFHWSGNKIFIKQNCLAVCIYDSLLFLKKLKSVMWRTYSQREHQRGNHNLDSSLTKGRIAAPARADSTANPTCRFGL